MGIKGGNANNGEGETNKEYEYLYYTNPNSWGPKLEAGVKEKSLATEIGFITVAL